MIKSNEERLFFKMADKLGVTTQNLKLAYKLSLEEIESEDTKADQIAIDEANNVPSTPKAPETHSTPAHDPDLSHDAEHNDSNDSEPVDGEPQA